MSVLEDKVAAVWASGMMARMARGVGFMKKDIYFAPIKTTLYNKLCHLINFYSVIDRTRQGTAALIFESVY